MIKIKPLRQDFIKPTKGTPNSAAYDLYVQEDVIVKNGRQVIPMGFAISDDMFCTAFEIHPRSGFASKGMEGYDIKSPSKGVDNNNAYVSLTPFRFNADVIYGLVDPDYRDEVGVIVYNHECEFMIKRGTRIAQMLPLAVYVNEYEIVDELNETERKGGFGSTGV